MPSFLDVKPNNQVRNYLDLGFTTQLKRQSDLTNDKTYKGEFVNSLEFDRMFEGVDIAKLLSNSMGQVMSIGLINLDGVKGVIQVKDQKGNVSSVIGNIDL